MNKKKIKKLSLNKEVLRKLTNDEMGKAAGGTFGGGFPTFDLDCHAGYDETITFQGIGGC